jgi:predicted Zn-dependent peptidase
MARILSGIEVSSSTDRAALTLETLLEQLGKLAKEQVRERELETAKSRVLAQYAGSIATVPGLARALAMLFASGAPSDFHATLPARARALDAERLRKVAARFFDVRRIGVAVAGDPNPLHEELDDRAKIHWSYLVERPR